MIIPLIDETTWLQALNSAPIWTPPAQTLLIIAPHPDDETLGAGGLIFSQRSRGVAITVVAVTDGENAYADTIGLAPIRRAEQTAALASLGVASENILRLGLPDSDVSSHEQDLITQLLPLITPNTHILAPWRGDFHPDHEACGRAAEEVARRTGAQLSSYFFWTWHRGTPNLLAGLNLHSFPLSKEALLAKTEALHCHHSQLVHESGDPILPEYLLAPASRPFETFIL